MYGSREIYEVRSGVGVLPGIGRTPRSVVNSCKVSASAVGLHRYGVSQSCQGLLESGKE